MLPRITEILNQKDFMVITRWNTNEIRCIDFKKIISDYPQSLKDMILDKSVFSTISLNKESQTIFLPNLLPYKDENGNTALGELDFCPDVLYENSDLHQTS
jgi:hypothetical protein